MSASNNRIRDYDTIHHLVSRIAHKVFFLGDNERNDLIEIIRRAAAFGGLRILGWCIMTNHFHILVHLPVRVDVSEDEVLRRVSILRGESGRQAVESQIAAWRLQGAEKKVQEWFNRQRERMYDIGEFMKTVKQWFTEDYNRRQSHVGTLWESVYHDKPVPMTVKDMSRVLGYIHLNPIRAAICTGFADYTWSSFCALAKGDEMALEGIRFVYDEPAASATELIDRHELLLDALLEGVKRQRAEEMARKRAAGFSCATDPLTNEALVAQAAAHIDEVQHAVMALNDAVPDDGSRTYRARSEVEKSIIAVLTIDPMASVDKIAKATLLKPSSVYGHLREMRKSGIISRQKRNAPWLINS